MPSASDSTATKVSRGSSSACAARPQVCWKFPAIRGTPLNRLGRAGRTFVPVETRERITQRRGEHRVHRVGELNAETRSPPGGGGASQQEAPRVFW